MDGVNENEIFRRNVSKTPSLKTAKAKIGFSAPAYSEAAAQDSGLNQTLLLDPQLGEEGLYCEAGILTEDQTCLVQPLVISYLDENEISGANDTWAAVSMDDGATWKRTNLSHSAEKLVVIDDVAYGVGTTAKPALAMYKNNILVAWTSYLCRGGTSGIPEEDANQGEALGEGDADDLYQVNGSQGYVDYSLLDRPDLGVKPYSCIWSARGVIQDDGTVDWRAAERHTSGRRDAYQLSLAVSGAGFGMTWQEDPNGLQPGQGAGPGHGMSGATVSKKTDIWYSFIAATDFGAICEDCDASGDLIGIDPDGRPKAANLMSSPVRISDNAACKVELDEVGGVIIHGAPVCEQLCATYGYSEPDENDLQFCKKDDVVLDGDTGASRPNIFLVGKELVLGYEETKGMGAGPNEDAQPEEPGDLGKNVIYHHYVDYSKVHIDNGKTIDAGVVLNLPTGITADGDLLYNNARRVRFVKQSLAAADESGTVLVALWREGAEGKGRPADIMMRRFVGGYAPENLVCDQTLRGASGARVAAGERRMPDQADTGKGDEAVCISGVYNLSSPHYGRLVWPDPLDPLDGDGDGETDGGQIPKVIDWTYHAHNLLDDAEANPYDDARAHRGILRGDFLVIGYSWTPNWAAARNGNDVYDLYLRRSFDGGRSFTDMRGRFEEPRNLSQLRLAYRDEPAGDPENEDWDGDLLGIGRGLTVHEPRLMAAPSTYAGAPYNPDDTQNAMVFFVAYGTSTNPDLNVQEASEEPVPQDIYWTFSDNLGETYFEVYNENNARWEHPGLGNMSRDAETQLSHVQESEAQLRTNPAGTRLFASWLAETDPVCVGATCGPCAPGQDPGSDVCYRRIDAIDPLARYDGDGDGDLDEVDKELLRAALRKNDPAFDYNEDGRVDVVVDMRLWEAAHAQYCQRPDAESALCP
jgi:hypothetical protein